MAVNTAEQLEAVLARIEQYGLVCIKRLPSQADLFCQALMSRLQQPLLLNDLSSPEQVQQQLAQVLGCAATPLSILSHIKQLQHPLPLVVHSDQVSLAALEYLFQLVAVTDYGYVHTPLLILETPATYNVWLSREGAALHRRFVVTLTIRERDNGWQIPVSVVALLLAGATLGYMVGWSDWRHASFPSMTPDTAVLLSDQQALSGEAAGVAAGGKPAAEVLVLGEQDFESIRLRVEQWRESWQSRVWDKYLACYIEHYVPLNDDMTHEEWVRWRRARLEKPPWIKVGIKDLRIEPLDHYQARVTFIQRYEAPGYKDRTIKELYMVRMAEGWRINAEGSLRSR
ncbi:MAG: hypothetical protein OIF57_02550 [Marinobacterium sp.]|nr:hypothetical protein [Marinobacterium sp.]